MLSPFGTKLAIFEGATTILLCLANVIASLILTFALGLQLFCYAPELVGIEVHFGNLPSLLLPTQFLHLLTANTHLTH